MYLAPSSSLLCLQLQGDHSGCASGVHSHCENTCAVAVRQSPFSVARSRKPGNYAYACGDGGVGDARIEDHLQVVDDDEGGFLAFLAFVIVFDCSRRGWLLLLRFDLPAVALTLPKQPNLFAAKGGIVAAKMVKILCFWAQIQSLFDKIC